MSHNGPKDTLIHFKKPSMTKQGFQSACDINQIMRKAKKTGMLPTKSGTFFGDITRIPADYQTSLDFIMESQERFDELPSDVRARFNNDAGQLLAFIDNPANLAEARRLGLVAPEVPSSTPAAEKPATAQPAADSTPKA